MLSASAASDTLDVATVSANIKAEASASSPVQRLTKEELRRSGSVYLSEAVRTLSGVSIKDYQIVCDKEGLDYNVRAAEYIQAAIKSVTGYAPSIVDDSEAAKSHEIVVGETSRAISAELNQTMTGVQFSMLTKGGNVALEGHYFVIAAAAYYFVDTYVKAGDVEIADATLVRDPIVKEAKNYILLIGDGMGLYQSQMYSYMTDNSGFSDGEGLFYGYMLPNLGMSRTNSFSGTTDSAASGTAMATGYKTENKHIATDRNGNELKSVTELAAELGKATAVMSTEKSTGATPSTFTAHTDHRDNTSDIEADQKAIAESLGTIINCGYEGFAPNSVKNSLEGNIADTLAKVSADTDGFFLMYEEAHIDKYASQLDLETTFKAVIRFNQAIARFMEYAFYNPDTVVIITADHETGGLAPSKFDGKLYFDPTTNGEHTDAAVPIFAWGYGTEFFNDAIIENVQIAQFIATAMGVSDFGDTANSWYNEIYPQGTDVELPILPF